MANYYFKLYLEQFRFSFSDLVGSRIRDGDKESFLKKLHFSIFL